jgi:plastocyanin
MKQLILIITILIYSINFSLAGDIKGKVKTKGMKHSGEVVIYIDKIPGKSFSPPKEHAKMDQKNLTFIPHVLPILSGTTVDFLNSDDVLHNVFTPEHCASKFNLGTWPKGEIRSYTFKEECTATMLCNVHPEMEAWVLTLETPYYTVSEKDGTYLIKDVPAGTYTLKVWHKKLKEQSVEITVPKDGSVTQNFELKR